MRLEAECWSDNQVAMLPVETAWQSTQDDPFAVECVFFPDSEEAVSWTFGRRLIADILSAEQLTLTGEGDVLGYIDTDEDNKKFVEMIFVAPDGEILFSMAYSGLNAFIKSSYRLISDEGASHVTSAALESELDDILASD